MNAKAFFENSSIRCRVELTHGNGQVEKKDFYKVSQLVNYCNEKDISIPTGDCIAVDALPNFHCEED